MKLGNFWDFSQKLNKIIKILPINPLGNDTNAFLHSHWDEG